MIYSLFKTKEKNHSEIKGLYEFIVERPFEFFEHKHLVSHVQVQIRETCDTKILQSAVESHCDIFITGDKDFSSINMIN
jgi:predicted nucleic acid-binding protein